MSPPLDLAEEHTLLLRQVAARVEDVLTAVQHDRWPARELASLVGYLRVEVLRQVADEEALLLPAAGSSPQVKLLVRDHVRLRAGAETLTVAADRPQVASADRIVTTARDFAYQLERHMRTEEAVLAAEHAPDTVAATTVLGSRPHEWYPLTEGPVIDLDALPADQVVDAVTARLIRLRPGEQVELRSREDLYPVWQAVDRFGPGRCGFVYLQEGPDRWRMRVIGRHATP